MEQKYTFNDVVQEYERFRPSYPRSLYLEIVGYSKIKENDKIFEIGCGTGKATEGFVEIGRIKMRVTV